MNAPTEASTSTNKCSIPHETTNTEERQRNWSGQGLQVKCVLQDILQLLLTWSKENALLRPNFKYKKARASRSLDFLFAIPTFTVWFIYLKSGWDERAWNWRSHTYQPVRLQINIWKLICVKPLTYNVNLLKYNHLIFKQVRNRMLSE